MTPSKRTTVLAALFAVAAVGAVTLLTSGTGMAAAQQSPAPCMCAPVTSVATVGTNLVHCQCGPATCVVSEHFTGQAKTYGFQCTK
ncbi:MAG TPA: hypothetical protein PLE54_13150 [Burkholderiaceae bacterium]|nr:hypothetical protein [Burkholderiaceae bacterium]HQR71549.1 hypothetical protein [Burkholderiaceae bacterium]